MQAELLAMNLETLKQLPARAW
ncbi:MAG: hypothetical protein RL084_1667, partial [Pseudomonadota bacterium]